LLFANSATFAGAKMTTCHPPFFLGLSVKVVLEQAVQKIKLFKWFLTL
jgi:hypothetical protein